MSTLSARWPALAAPVRPPFGRSLLLFRGGCPLTALCYEVLPLDSASFLRAYATSARTY